MCTNGEVYVRMRISKYNFHATISLRQDQIFCKCGNYLYEVSNGLLDIAWICSKCFKVYQLELRNVPSKKISKEFIEQSKEELIKRGIIKQEEK